ncbi:hypothetical protein OV203_07320 [Nannocystis sp. ILAH1]|uniref:hypothetical protein n=1 Tax=unclassified Nannocystis TaxID=2627009 RepID=UPI0022718833|nr:MULTISPECIES: hypothetical protein [unclassified Nannocystis]MCY0986925.1 hypothetical protein [Nannocystis sp. ILAH1]MCY1071809.1 hypothetical protein [Nannocystis sp. RBIL2]
MPEYLADYDRFGLPPDEALRRVIARAAADPQFLADLDALFFKVQPMLAERLDCEAPHFFVMARDGVGNAWGVYVDPELAPTRGTPWVMWEHEDDALNYVADDTEQFFARLLDFCAYHRWSSAGCSSAFPVQVRPICSRRDPWSGCRRARCRPDRRFEPGDAVRRRPRRAASTRRTLVLG